jgi:hypothetical protein
VSIRRGGIQVKPISRVVASLVLGLACSSAASAADLVRIQATIRQRGQGNLPAAPGVTVESGKQATIQTGQLLLAMTPTAQQDGTVTIALTVTEIPSSGEPIILGQPLVHVGAGRTAMVQIGTWDITLTPSVAK